jgi:hypothetical protein
MHARKNQSLSKMTYEEKKMILEKYMKKAGINKVTKVQKKIMKRNSAQGGKGEGLRSNKNSKKKKDF